MIFWLVIAAIFIFLLIISRKLMFVVLFVALQYFSHHIVERFRLNVVPFVNFDYELSNIITILVTRFFGLKYALVVIGLSMVIHGFHEEVVDIFGIVDYLLRGAILVVGVAVFSSVPLPALIPGLILVQKLVMLAIGKLFFDYRLLSASNFKELFTVMVYYAGFSLF